MLPEAQKKKTNAKGQLVTTFDTCGKDAHDHEHKHLKCNERNYKGYSGRVGVFCVWDVRYTSLGKIQSYFLQDVINCHDVGIFVQKHYDFLNDYDS